MKPNPIKWRLQRENWWSHFKYSKTSVVKVHYPAYGRIKSCMHWNWNWDLTKVDVFRKHIPKNIDATKSLMRFAVESFNLALPNVNDETTFNLFFRFSAHFIKWLMQKEWIAFIQVYFHCRDSLKSTRIHSVNSSTQKLCVSLCDASTKSIKSKWR